MVNWAAPQNRGFGELDLYRWICTAGFVQLDVQMLYSIKYCVQAGIGWYRLDLPSVGPRGTLVITAEVITLEMGPGSQKAKNTIGPDLRSFLGISLSTLNSNIDHQFPGHFWIITK